MPLKLLMLLKSNWELLGATFLLVSLLFGIYHMGADDARTECAIAAARDIEERQQQINNLQKLMDEKAQDYEASRAAQESQKKDIEREYANLKAKHSDFTTCHAGADFVQLYEQIGSATSGKSVR